MGCVPSKMLLHAGEVLHLARNCKLPGIEIEVKRFNFRALIQDELALVERMREEKYGKVLQHLEHVAFFEGMASFLSENEVEANGKALRGEKFVVATGSTTTVPPIEGIREAGFVTHIEALRLKQLPKELIVVGASALGLEFAQMYSRFGSKVTLLEALPRIFPPGEEELTRRLREIFESEGLAVKTGMEVKRAQKAKGKKKLFYLNGGREEAVSGDEILLAAGNTPNTKSLNLEKAGVEVDKRDAIVANHFLQTSQPHIYAAGDVTNLPLRLEPTAGREGTLAAQNALTGSQKSIDYHSVPYTIFTDPQLAGVGWTEEEQMKHMGTCSCRTLPFSEVPRGILTHRTEGLLKMVVHPETRQILGVHVLSPHAGELIAQAMLFVKNKNTVEDVIESLPMFPTLSEGIKIAAMSFTKDISKLSCCV